MGSRWSVRQRTSWRWCIRRRTAVKVYLMLPYTMAIVVLVAVAVSMAMAMAMAMARRPAYPQALTKV